MQKNKEHKKFNHVSGERDVKAKTTDQNQGPEKTSANNDTVISSFASNPFSWGERKSYVYVGCLILIIALAIGGFMWWQIYHTDNQDTAAANAAEQAYLQKSFTVSLNSGKSQTVVDDTTNLINGKLSGKFTFSDTQLAEYYMEAGSAYYNIKNYAQAVTYFKAASKYDSSLQQAALEGEVSAGYALGERRQLIPMLSQLEAMSAKVHNPLVPSPSQYQNDITAIQNNQQVDL